MVNYNWLLFFYLVQLYCDEYEKKEDMDYFIGYYINYFDIVIYW